MPAAADCERTIVTNLRKSKGKQALVGSDTVVDHQSYKLITKLVVYSFLTARSVAEFMKNEQATASRTRIYKILRSVVFVFCLLVVAQLRGCGRSASAPCQDDAFAFVNVARAFA